MLLKAGRSQLLVVDLQERLVPAIDRVDRILRNVELLIRAAERLGVPATVTEQYPKGLGPTVPPVRDILPADAAILPKTAFSAAADPGAAERVARLAGSGRDQLVVCGVEAHVCVLQSAIGFKQAGAEVFVVGDAVSSRSPHSVPAACARLLHAGCHWVTAEMVVFEWMERAGTEAFRALSPLLKEPAAGSPRPTR